MKMLAVAAATAGLLVVSTAGATETEATQQREAVAVQVDASKVNFADAEAVARFRRDVERQIAEACNPGDRLGADMKPDFECRRQMAANLEPTVVELAARAQRDDVQFVGVE